MYFLKKQRTYVRVHTEGDYHDSNYNVLNCVRRCVGAHDDDVLDFGEVSRPINRRKNVTS